MSLEMRSLQPRPRGPCLVSHLFGCGACQDPERVYRSDAADQIRFEDEKHAAPCLETTKILYKRTAPLDVLLNDLGHAEAMTSVRSLISAIRT